MYKCSINGTIVSNDDKWIYDWLEWDACCPKDIAEHIAAAAGDEMEIVVNSGGGSVVAANEIYESIRSYTGKVLFKVIYAGSAASVIVEAAYSEISPVGMYMIHNARSRAQGDYREMQRSADLLITINTTITNAYMEKTGMDRETLFQLMDAETWMTAEDAVGYGFVDSISENMQYKQPQSSQNASPSSFVCMASELPEKVMECLRQFKPAIDGRSLPDGKMADYFSNIPKPDDPTTNKEMEEKMTLSEFLAEHPEAKAEYDAAIQAAGQSATDAERSRMQKLDDISASVPREMLLDAKYKTPVDAEKLAWNVMMANAQAGERFFENQIQGAKPAEGIIPTPEPLQGSEEDNRIADAIADAANRKRRTQNGKKLESSGV